MKFTLFFGLIFIIGFAHAQSRINIKDTSLYFILTPHIDSVNLKYDLDSANNKVFYKDTLGKKMYYSVGEESSFVGGMPAWRHFLQRNLNARDLYYYVSNKDFKDGIFKQTAIVEFTVCTDGSLCDFRVVNNTLPYIQNEALRVMQKSPNWKPAMQKHRIVKSRMRQPITFVVRQE